MSKLLNSIAKLINNGEILISAHGYDELRNDNIFVKDIIGTIDKAVVIKEYLDYAKGPCILVLQNDKNGEPIHVVWGISKNFNSPAVLVTAYRPVTEHWTEDFTRRKK
ncbi:MAG: DUF4258 domain-containing protein [bacterium]|nr:DUF4258 domain-containing protein [Bacteroidota bacterium]